MIEQLDKSGVDLMGYTNALADASRDVRARLVEIAQYASDDPEVLECIDDLSGWTAEDAERAGARRGRADMGNIARTIIRELDAAPTPEDKP
jgi:hypothetical protein